MFADRIYPLLCALGYAALLLISYIGCAVATASAVLFLMVPNLMAASGVVLGAFAYIYLGKIAWRKIEDLK